MNKYIIKGSPSEIDRLLIPNVIYEPTINRNKKIITEYLFNNPNFAIQFVGFYSQLKNTNRLASERKCNCFYKMPWLTKYASDNNILKTYLLYDQQLEEYRYMIRYNYPSLQQSYIVYLSNIVLSIILDMKRFKYNMDNNKDVNAIFHKYGKYFKTLFDFKVWVNETEKLLISKEKLY